MDLKQLIEECHKNSIAHGWWDNYEKLMKQYQWYKDLNGVDSSDKYFNETYLFWNSMRLNWIAAKLALIHSEVSELEEAETSTNFAEELADICIRVFDLIGGLKIDIKVIKNSMFFGPTYIYPYRSIHWHISQALECLRNDEWTEFERALFFVYGRCLAKAEDNNVNLKQAIRKKMEYNKTRPYMHGKRL